RPHRRASGQPCCRAPAVEYRRLAQRADDHRGLNCQYGLGRTLTLERADGPFYAAVAFRRTHERRARADAGESDLLLKGIAHVLAPVIMPQLKPESDVATDGAEMLAHTQRVPARRALGRVRYRRSPWCAGRRQAAPPPGPPRASSSSSDLSPAQVRRLRNDRSIVGTRSPRSTRASRGL